VTRFFVGGGDSFFYLFIEFVISKFSCSIYRHLRTEIVNRLKAFCSFRDLSEIGSVLVDRVLKW
jgi:hypothetical protein